MTQRHAEPGAAPIGSEADYQAACNETHDCWLWSLELAWPAKKVIEKPGRNRAQPVPGWW